MKKNNMNNTNKGHMIAIEHMSNDWTNRKVAEAKINGYVEFDKLSPNEKKKLTLEIATLFAACTPSIINYVMDCQMGRVDECFFELEGGKPVLLTPQQVLQIFNTSMIAKESSGFESRKVA